MQKVTDFNTIIYKNTYVKFLSSINKIFKYFENAYIYIINVINKIVKSINIYACECAYILYIYIHNVCVCCSSNLI